MTIGQFLSPQPRREPVPRLERISRRLCVVFCSQGKASLSTLLEPALIYVYVEIGGGRALLSQSPALSPLIPNASANLNRGAPNCEETL